MIRNVFEWRQDEEYGGEGWIMKGKPNFNASTGNGIAHDCLEHFRNDGDDLDAEMRAFGSMLWIRVETGWFFNNGRGTLSAADNLGSDIARFLEQMQHGELNLPKPGRTARLDDCMEDEIEAVIIEALKMANAEMQCNADEDYQPAPFERGWETDRMIGWMRIGYRKCAQRWKHSDAHSVAYAFDQIRALVHKQYKDGQLGDELHIAVCPRRAHVEVNRRYAEDLYAY